jgi:hypothetical protein
MPMSETLVLLQNNSTPWNKILRDKLTFAQLAKKFPAYIDHEVYLPILEVCH